MEPDRFDAISRALTSSASRRTTLRALLSTVLGNAVLEQSADALVKSGKRHKKKSGRDRAGRKDLDRDRDNTDTSIPTDDRTQDSVAEPTPDVADDPALSESAEVVSDEVTAENHNCLLANAACTRPGQCCTGKCLRSGKCSCDRNHPCPQPTNPCKKVVCSSTGRCVTKNKAAGTACPDDGNPCTKDVCNDRGRCTHPNKKNGSICEAGKVCQSGVCTSTTTCTPTSCTGGRECQSNGTCACPAEKLHAAPDQGCDDTCRECCIDDHCPGDQVCQTGSCRRPVAAIAARTTVSIARTAASAPNRPTGRARR
jgi:hypothetical protein